MRLPYGATCVGISDLETIERSTDLIYVVLAYEDENGQALKYERLEGDDLRFPTKGVLVSAIAKANAAAGCPRCGDPGGRYGAA